MINETPYNGLCFVCNRLGNVRQVLRDDVKIFAGMDGSTSFFSLFDSNNKRKPLEFWNKLQHKTAISDWQLDINLSGITKAYKFSGIAAGQEFIITALNHDEDPDFMLEIVEIINERQNMLGTSEKSISTLKKKRGFSDEVILNEMTSLNNEIVNAQRALMKQNAEITRLNSRLQQVNNNLEQFTYVASHDLKEPLRMITSFMTLLKTKYGNQLDSKAQSYINTAIDGGKRMQKMITDLLELSRAARTNEAKELVNMNEVMAEVNENIFGLVEEHSAKIIIETELPVIRGFRNDMIRLIQNLISNSIKFRKKEVTPIVKVSAIEQKDCWLFSIVDNGIGINKDQFGNIFEIFSRLNSREFEGSGIGLAICKKIVEVAGGKIWLTSEEGAGSKFYFTILKNNT